jgi:hypothetical protein
MRQPTRADRFRQIHCKINSFLMKCGGLERRGIGNQPTVQANSQEEIVDQTWPFSSN